MSTYQTTINSKLIANFCHTSRQERVVGTATHYMLDGAVFERRLVETFRAHADRPRDPPTYCTINVGILPGYKVARARS